MSQRTAACLALFFLVLSEAWSLAEQRWHIRLKPWAAVEQVMW